VLSPAGKRKVNDRTNRAKSRVILQDVTFAADDTKIPAEAGQLRHDDRGGEEAASSLKKRAPASMVARDLYLQVGALSVLICYSIGSSESEH